jgi:hypothetical protein
MGQCRNRHANENRLCHATSCPAPGDSAPRLQPLRWTSIWQPSLSPENGVGRPAQGMPPEYFIGLRGIQTACKVERGHRMADCPNFWLQFCVKFHIKITVWESKKTQPMFCKSIEFRCLYGVIISIDRIELFWNAGFLISCVPCSRSVILVSNLRMKCQTEACGRPGQANLAPFKPKF